MSCLPSAKKLMGGAKKLRPQDVFNALAYVGDGQVNRKLTTGIDMTKGGLVWGKSRTRESPHGLVDTERGGSLYLSSASTNSQSDNGPYAFVNEFLSDGVNVRYTTFWNDTGNSVLWSFRKAKKFFDIVTYTGNGVAGRRLSHGLGVAPGVVIVKRLDGVDNWNCYHRLRGASKRLTWNLNQGENDDPDAWGSTEPTADYFVVGNGTANNQSGGRYIAYLFAQNPDLIDCGSYVGNASATGPSVICGNGWQPQFMLVKNVTNASGWVLLDKARGIDTATDRLLFANSPEPEAAEVNRVDLTSSGFQPMSSGGINASGTCIYMAIRSPT